MEALSIPRTLNQPESEAMCFWQVVQVGIKGGRNFDVYAVSLTGYKDAQEEPKMARFVKAPRTLAFRTQNKFVLEASGPFFSPWTEKQAPHRTFLLKSNYLIASCHLV